MVETLGEKEPISKSSFPPIVNYYIKGMAICMSLFHLYTAATLPFGVFVQRGVHLFFILSIIFILNPFSKKGVGVLDYFLTLLGMAVTLYVVIFYQEIEVQGGIPSTLQIIFGSIAVICIIEGARRSTGLGLPILTIAFLIYALWGNHFPRAWGHPGLTVERMVGYLYVTGDGIWSIPLGVSATVLILFMLFGEFLSNAGVGRFFAEFASVLAGRMVGGPAQMAVISSALLGTVTGSSTANVATTGSFTIPLMKSRGYPPHFAAAVEAVASTGGQIMPPVMGAGAFIMADILGEPYSSIAKAAAIPAVLYFLGVFICVRFEALKQGLTGKEKARRVIGVLWEGGHLFIPVLVILYYVIAGYSPFKASYYGIISILIVSWVRKESRINLTKVFASLEGGGQKVIGIAVVCACAGIVLGVMNMTGLGIKLTELIMRVSAGSLLYALLLAMVASLILGMELPTAVAYLMAAAVAGPALVQLGLKPLVAHLFIFYFSILGTITPPVCLSVYVASGIANADWLKTAGWAIRMGLPAFIIPFIFVYNPALLLMGSPLFLIQAIGTAVIGMYLMAGAVVGFHMRKINILERVFILVAALALLVPEIKTDIFGLVVAAFAIMVQKFFPYWTLFRKK
ncbi:MAG: TRAP transporter permease [Thermodesulfobacteriota bacterium]